MKAVIIWLANRWIDAGYWVLDRFPYEPEPLVEWNGLWLAEWKVERLKERLGQ